MSRFLKQDLVARNAALSSALLGSHRLISSTYQVQLIFSLLKRWEAEFFGYGVFQQVYISANGKSDGWHHHQPSHVLKQTRPLLMPLEAFRKFPYLSIICAACCARLTSQNGNTVPINSVPAPAMPRATHVVQPIEGFSSELCSCDSNCPFSTFLETQQPEME